MSIDVIGIAEKAKLLAEQETQQRLALVERVSQIQEELRLATLPEKDKALLSNCMDWIKYLGMIGVTPTCAVNTWSNAKFIANK